MIFKSVLSTEKKEENEPEMAIKREITKKKSKNSRKLESHTSHTLRKTLDFIQYSTVE
jgi:hypothetical protein